MQGGSRVLIVLWRTWAARLAWVLLVLSVIKSLEYTLYKKMA